MTYSNTILYKINQRMTRLEVLQVFTGRSVYYRQIHKEMVRLHRLSDYMTRRINRASGQQVSV